MFLLSRSKLGCCRVEVVEAVEAVAEADLIVTAVEAAHNVAAARLAAAAAPIVVLIRVLEK